MTVVKCPLCEHPLSPPMKGSYTHFPDARFCEKCIRFIEVSPEELKAQESKE